MNKITIITNKPLTDDTQIIGYFKESDAEKEMSNDKEMKYKYSCTVNGYVGDDYSYEITDICKYYNPKLNMIRHLITCLYELDGCVCGGLCHIVTDDNNIDDDDLTFVIGECIKEPDRLESGLCKLICEELLKLSMQQRALVFSSYYADVLCDHDCKICEIEQGKIIEK